MDGDYRQFGDRTPGVEQHETTATVLTYTVGLEVTL